MLVHTPTNSLLLDVPDPFAFRPERFLGPDAPDTYTWIPFGGATRRCLGASFALFEMKQVLTAGLSRIEPAAASASRCRQTCSGVRGRKAPTPSSMAT